MGDKPRDLGSDPFIINMWRAIFAAFLQQLKTTVTSIANLPIVFTAVPTVVVIGWIAHQSDNPAVLTYIAVGLPLMINWNGLIFRVGWSLNDELSLGTIEFALISRTPIMVVLFGKTLK